MREADFSDAAGIAAVHVAGWRDAYREIIDADYLESLSDIRHSAMWADVLDQEIREGATFVAENAKSGIIGFADCGPERGHDDATSGEITAIYVMPEFHRRGIGHALVGTCRAWLAEAGRTSVAIWVLADNAAARQFYETLGGAESETRMIRVAGGELEEVCYRWANGNREGRATDDDAGDADNPL